MSTIFLGRFTAKFDGPFVVFIIGMRVNRVFQFSKWIPVVKAMPPMIAELKKHPEMGLLHAELMIYWRGVATVQYWRSFEQLHAYAHMRGGNHLPAWAEFDWIGKELAVGSVRLRVVSRITRCAATNVNPATGDRDLNIPKALMTGFRHADCGIYAEVIDGGRIAPGDALTVV